MKDQPTDAAERDPFARILAAVGMEDTTIWSDVADAVEALADQLMEARAEARVASDAAGKAESKLEELRLQYDELRAERDEAQRLLRSKTILCEAQQDTFREAIRQRDEARCKWDALRESFKRRGWTDALSVMDNFDVAAKESPTLPEKLDEAAGDKETASAEDRAAAALERWRLQIRLRNGEDRWRGFPLGLVMSAIAEWKAQQRAAEGEGQ
jgi:phage-related tail protein